MSKLIALVATAVLMDGVRTVIEPGQELPDLSAHDQRELLQAGAAQNPADTAAQEKSAARAAAAAAAEFEAARERAQQAQQAQASTSTDAAAVTATTDPTKPAAKPAARK